MPSAAGPKDSSDSCSKKEEVLRVLAKYGIYDNKVVLWGTGKPLREFLWSEDMADASVHSKKHLRMMSAFQTLLAFSNKL